ncbi:MAG: hypothetical protein JXA37_00905 [Chloroflexia bacterium]|nr:hypothetical protein [Chloroflexia bacterium]
MDVWDETQWISYWQTLAQHDVRQLLVLEDGHMAGLLRRRDITKWLQLHSELEQS